MIKNIIIFIYAVVTVQCQLQATSYSRSCPCGLPAMAATAPMPSILPARPPCGNTLSIPMPVPNVASPYSTSLPLSILSAPYDIATALKSPVLSTPLELPISLSAPSPKCIKSSPYELALPVSLSKPSCGCLEAALPKLEMSIPRNPFLPAASPVSAMAPFSTLLPPANSCSRCQYLKKIPIPPPCI